MQTREKIGLKCEPRQEIVLDMRSLEKNASQMTSSLSQEVKTRGGNFSFFSIKLVFFVNNSSGGENKKHVQHVMAYKHSNSMKSKTSSTFLKSPFGFQ